MPNMLNFNDKKMKKIIHLFIIFILGACAQEDELTPTGVVKDWFAIQPGEGEWNEIACDIYTNYGCSVFKNDTLGKEFRGFDNAGDSIIYYETLKIGYSIESFYKVNFTLCKDEEKLIQGIKIVRDLLMPQLEKFGTITRSYLLVDTVISASDTTVCEYGKRDFETTLLGLTVSMTDGTRKNITEFTQEERKNWLGKIVAIEVANRIQLKYSELVKEFYTIQKEIVENEGNKYAHGVKGTTEDFGGGKGIPDSRPLGFLEWSSLTITYNYFNNPKWTKYEYYSPTEEKDFETFVAAALLKTPEEFESENGEYPYVMEKFSWMKNFLQE